MKNAGTLGSEKKVGLWRTVVVRNLPYEDDRRTGKVRNLNFTVSFLPLDHSLL